MKRIAAVIVLALGMLAVPAAANAATSCGCSQPIGTHRIVNRPPQQQPVIGHRTVNRYVSNTIGVHHVLRIPAWCAAWLSR